MERRLRPGVTDAGAFCMDDAEVFRILLGTHNSNALSGRASTKVSVQFCD